MNKRIVILLMILILVPLKVMAAGGFDVSPTSVSINPGETKTITITSNNAVGKLDISSTNPSVVSASVASIFIQSPNTSQSITITGNTAGTATISVVATNNFATLDEEILAGQTKTITVNVVARIDPTRVTLDKSNITITEGSTSNLVATVEPSDANDKTVTWSSSNPSVATVSNGRVQGIKEGTATITASTVNGKTATCTVTVKKATVHVTGISISPKSYTFYVGDSYTLEYSITPSNADNKGVTWLTSNSKVVTVKDGVIKAIKEGTATITVMSNDGGKKATSTITVAAKPSSSSSTKPSSSPKPSSSSVQITIKLSDTNVNFIKGEEYTLTATVTGSNKKIIWESSDTKIVTVDNGKLKGIEEGNAKITAKVEGTNVSAVCEVKIINPDFVGIQIDEEINVYLGKTKPLELIVMPTDMEIKKTEYQIEDETIISVEEGIINGLALGSTKLKIKVNDKYEAETTINVIEEPMTLTIVGYNIGFNEKIYNYELQINKEKSLAITSNKNITVNGNNNLKNKSIIKITNTETNMIYEIHIKKKAGTIKYLFIGIIAILVIINLINLLKIIKNKKQ